MGAIGFLLSIVFRIVRLELSLTNWWEKTTCK